MVVLYVKAHIEMCLRLTAETMNFLMNYLIYQTKGKPLGELFTVECSNVSCAPWGAFKHRPGRLAN